MFGLGRKPSYRRLASAVARCPKDTCNSADVLQGAKIYHTIPGDPPELVHVGFAVICLKCTQAYCVTPEGVYVPALPFSGSSGETKAKTVPPIPLHPPGRPVRWRQPRP